MVSEDENGLTTVETTEDTSTLTIRSCQTGVHDGTIVCIAKNCVGTEQAYAFLTINSGRKVNKLSIDDMIERITELETSSFIIRAVADFEQHSGEK